MVLWSPWFGVLDVVSAFDFTGEDIIIDISHTFDAFLAEKYGWTTGF